MAILLILITALLIVTLIMLNHTHQVAQEKLDKMQRVWQIGTKFNNDINLDRLIHRMIEAAKEEIGAEACSLYLLDEENNELYFEVTLGKKSHLLKELRLKMGQGVAGYVAEKGEILNIKDIKKYENFKEGRQIAKDIGFEEKAMLTLPVRSEDKIIGVLQFINKRNGSFFTEDDQKLMEMFVEMQVVSNFQKATLYKQLRTIFMDSVRTVASAIDAKDKYTIGHCQRVSEYTLLLGKKIGLEYEELEDLELAALLHDVGKIGISDTILNKQERLTEEEYEIIKEHPLLGAEILKQITTLKREIIQGAKYHHERYDGSGYCEGLKGEEIPLFARMIAIADAYDAMVGSRVYREGKTMDYAIEELKRGIWKQFDGDLVEAFVVAIQEANKEKS